MRPSKDFNALYKTASDRINRLRLLAQISCLRPTDEFSKTNQELAYVTLELHTAYSNFARSYFLSCTINPTTISGVKVTCNPLITNFIDAIDVSMKVCKNRIWLNANGNKNWAQRDEPSWHQPNVLIDSCREINCSNQSNIISAFSVPTSAFADLTKYRNFFAHRNKSTMGTALNTASQYGVSVTSYHPVKVLCSNALGRTQAIILDWIDDINIVIELLCQ